MNVFKLNEDPSISAMLQNDKHVVKMATEYAQLLSTAHRVLDGEEYYDKTANNRRIKRWRMSDDVMESTLYKASHINHPSNIWTRETSANYRWLHTLWIETCNEYTFRYGKEHGAYTKLHALVADLPKNITEGELTFLPQAMPDDVKGDDSVLAYQKYYRQYKAHFSKWTKRDTPDFMNA